MLEQDHLLMNRLMKLIIRFDKSKDKDGYEEVLEPRRLPKSLVRILVTNSAGMEEPQDVRLGPSFPYKPVTDDNSNKKKKKKHKKSNNGRENNQSKRDGMLSPAACFSKARELFTDIIIKEKKFLPVPGQYDYNPEELLPKLTKDIRLE